MFGSVFKTGIRGKYSLSENPSLQSDPWSVYPAKNKLNGNVVSVFIFDKAKFENQIHRLTSSSRSSRNARAIVAELLELLRGEVNLLTKLRHPHILTVLEVLEETKLKVLFVTEPVTGTLSTSEAATSDELSIQKGLLEISKGLQFLHNYCSLVHLNLQPSSIFITTTGDWKLAGFRFLVNISTLSPLERENFCVMNSSSLVSFMNMNLNFTAPELVLDSSGSGLDVASDIWSLGMLIFTAFNQGSSLITCLDNSSPNEYKDQFRKFLQKFYNHKVSELQYIFQKIPLPLHVLITQMLPRFPHDRITIDQFIDSEYFNGSLIKLMWFVDEYSTKSNDEKITFLGGLLSDEELLSSLPASFKNSKLLPILLDSIENELKIIQPSKVTAESNTLICSSLKVVFEISDGLSKLSFQDRIGDRILKLSKSRKDMFSNLLGTSIEIRLIIAENMPVIARKMLSKQGVEVFKEISELSFKHLPQECEDMNVFCKLQDALLKRTLLFADGFDFPYLKNTYVPNLCHVFKTTTSLSTKVQTIDTLQALLDKKLIDRYIFVEQILPILDNIKSRDKRIIEKVIALFVNVTHNGHLDLDMEVLVDKLLVQCVKMTFACTNFTREEFELAFATVIGIQKRLAEKKIPTLSVPELEGRGSSFNSVINTSSLRLGNKEELEHAPKFQPMSSSLMNPKEPLSGPNSHTFPLNSNVMPLKASNVSPSATVLSPNDLSSITVPNNPTMVSRSSLPRILLQVATAPLTNLKLPPGFSTGVLQSKPLGFSSMSAKGSKQPQGESFSLI